MPHYKLIYFNMRGRAEIIRYLLAYLDIKYEDHRISQDDWPAVKQTVPFGKIPILEVDGVPLHQSLAIGRFLAREAGLAGKTELEQCQVDAIIDTLDDFMSRFPWAEKKQEIKIALLIALTGQSFLSYFLHVLVEITVSEVVFTEDRLISGNMGVGGTIEFGTQNFTCN
ncbi:hematopoietic prostaglandin D synthase isoform X2 [Notamacropus eugenii]|uniref:hematopoietic prostaglandin D synthase isoform X2 n=1 Tax=Notamacropus eugenii TaxID=9315 RepID=UPI003B68477F